MMLCRNQTCLVKLPCFMQVQCYEVGTHATFRSNFKLLHGGYRELEDDIINVIEILKTTCHRDVAQRASPEDLLANANVLALRAAHNL